MSHMCAVSVQISLKHTLHAIVFTQREAPAALLPRRLAAKIHLFRSDKVWLVCLSHAFDLLEIRKP